jgi:hypothetical protein
MLFLHLSHLSSDVLELHDVSLLDIFSDLAVNIPFFRLAHHVSQQAFALFDMGTEL